MKQFIYLDTDMVNSIIAQKDKGLILGSTKETEDVSGKASEKGINGSITGTLEGGIFKLARASGELAISGELKNQTHYQTLIKEIESKTLHDAAYDIAYDQLKIETNLDAVEFGEFIELDRQFEVVDFDYLDGLFLKDGFIDFIKKNARESVKQATNNHLEKTTDREQRRKLGAEIKQSIRLLMENSDKQYDDIVDIIKALKSIIPYNRMLVSHDGFIIPLEDQYFRVNPKTLGFKHGGNVRCVGYVTNLIGKDTEPDSENIFGYLQFTVNEIFRKLLPTKEDNLYIVHPIAVYYGQ